MVFSSSSRLRTRLSREYETEFTNQILVQLANYSEAVMYSQKPTEGPYFCSKIYRLHVQTNAILVDLHVNMWSHLYCTVELDGPICESHELERIWKEGSNAV